MDTVKFNSMAINQELHRALENILQDALACKRLGIATAGPFDVALCILLLKGLRS